MGSGADRNSETLALRETMSPTLTEPRTVDEEEKTMIPVETDGSSVFWPASQNEVDPSEEVSFEVVVGDVTYLSGNQTGDVGQSLSTVSGKKCAALDAGDCSDVRGSG